MVLQFTEQGHLTSTQGFSQHEHSKILSRLAPTYRKIVSTTNSPQSLNLMSVCFPLKIQCKCLLYPYLCHISEQEYLIYFQQNPLYSMVLNHSFSVDKTSFLVKLLMLSFFFSGKNLPDRNLNLLSFSVQQFFDLAATHWHCLYRQDWSNQFELQFQHDTFSCKWVHVSPIPAKHVQWQVLIFVVFSNIIQSFWNGSFID